MIQEEGGGGVDNNKEIKIYWADNMWEFECVASREQPYQLSLSSIIGSKEKGAWMCEVHFIITTTTAPPTGGQTNSRWSLWSD